MKNKISALFVMAIFLVGLMPLAFAQGVQSKDAPEVLELKAHKSAVIAGGKITHVRTSDARNARHMKLRTAAEERRARGPINKHIKDLRGHTGVFDENQHRHAVDVVLQAMGAIERLSLLHEKLADRLESQPHLQEAHPHALNRIETAQKELANMYQVLEGVIADDEVTSTEYRSEVYPILQKIGPQIHALKNNDDFRGIRESHVRDFVERFREESLPKIRARHRARGLSDAATEERVASIERELGGFVKADHADRLGRLERIRASMV